MRVLGRDLKKIIKEEITQADIAARRDAIQTAIAKGRASTGSDIFGGRHPEIDVEPMKQFFNDVFSGKKTVSSTYNSPEENLYINKVLSVFEKIRNMSDLTSFPPSTYPKAGIIKLQKATGIDIDGVFGRQALAAAISPAGSPIINPSNYAEYRAHAEHVARLVAELERGGSSFVRDMERQDAETDRILAGATMEDIIKKSLFLQAIANDSELRNFLGLDQDDIAKIDRELPDVFSRSLLLRWFRDNDVATLLGDTEESMAALQTALDQVSGERLPSGTYSGQLKSSVSPMNESLTHEPKNITERLMERWFK
jgi:hypothetical protein